MMRAAVLMLLGALPAAADPVADACVRATEAVIARPLDAAGAAATGAEVAAARAADPARTDRVGRVLAEMAVQAVRAEHPSHAHCCTTRCAGRLSWRCPTGVRARQRV